MSVKLPKPSDIDASRHMYNSFDHCETEISAGYIVRMMQEREAKTGECWEPFTEGDIEARYNKAGYQGYSFNKLLGRHYGHGEGYKSTEFLSVLPDGSFQVTLEFVYRCFKSSPKGASDEDGQT